MNYARADMTHDKLCPSGQPGSCCLWIGNCDCQCVCDFIGLIREDERRKQPAIEVHP